MPMTTFDDMCYFLVLMAAGAILAVFVVWVIFRWSRRLDAQRKQIVYVRTPQRSSYSVEKHVAKSARVLYEYAALAARIYEDRNKPVRGWSRWVDVPDQDTKQMCEEVGLHWGVWEKKSNPPIVAVVFRGTRGTNCKDWKSNLRRLQPLKKLRNYSDHYTVVERVVGHALVSKLNALKGQNNTLQFQLVAVGHSLGGGLAQFFAYTFPRDEAIDHTSVSRVFAFDWSPVSGWSSVANKELRDKNAEKLEIYQVFEHGEVLAFLRLLVRSLLSLFPRSRKSPRIWTYRFNYTKSSGPTASHSMNDFAAALARFRNLDPPTKVADLERLQQLQMIYDYIKFHIGLYIGTPSVLMIFAQGLGIEQKTPFLAGMADMVILYLVAGIHAGWFMGTHVNTKWLSDYLDEFEEVAFSPERRFLHHWTYWAGLIVGISGIVLSKFLK